MKRSLTIAGQVVLAIIAIAVWPMLRRGGLRASNMSYRRRRY